MAVWKYEALDKTGKIVAGKIEAENQNDVRKNLRAEGLRPKSIKSPSLFEQDLGQILVDKGLARPFSTQDLARFTKQFSIMISSGVPIMQSLEILHRSERNLALKKAVKQISRDVGEGKTLEESMSKINGFSRVYCSLVKAGESGGILDKILDKLAEQLDQNEKIVKKVKGALTYPAIIVIVSIVVVYGMLTFVVPQFVGMLKDANQEIPAITQFVIDASHFFQNYSLHMLLFLAITAFFIHTYLKTPEGRSQFDRLMLHVPLFNEVIISGSLATFCRTLSILLSSGVSMVDAIEISCETIANKKIIEDFQIIKKMVVEGRTFSQPLGKVEYFPEMLSQMVKVGEQTGNLDQMLMRVSVVLEEQLGSLIENMTKLVEPIILVVMGGVVAVILLAMYMPVFVSAGGG
jgi:type IV pilus assembly protein PilC